VILMLIVPRGGNQATIARNSNLLDPRVVYATVLGHARQPRDVPRLDGKLVPKEQRAAIRGKSQREDKVIRKLERPTPLIGRRRPNLTLGSSHAIPEDDPTRVTRRNPPSVSRRADGNDRLGVPYGFKPQPVFFHIDQFDPLSHSVRRDGLAIRSVGHVKASVEMQVDGNGCRR